MATAEQPECPDPAAERTDRITELVAALILSIAALLSSYAGFQAQLWDGEQATNYALAEQARTAASEKAMVSAEVRTLDILLFSQWLNAYAGGDDRLQRFYRERFRPEFEQAFEEWLQTEPLRNSAAPLSPLEMGSYARSADREARRLQNTAENYFAIGGRANNISNGFGQVTVILALCLFIGGIVQSFKGKRQRIALLGVATLALVWGAVRILALPALRLTL